VCLFMCVFFVEKIIKYTQYTDTPNYAYKDTHTQSHRHTHAHMHNIQTLKKESLVQNRWAKTNTNSYIRAFIYKHTYTQTQIHTETHTHA